MTNNPFLSKVFTNIWLKYFQGNRAVYNFDCIENVSFLKNKYLPIYTNVGENITNGMFYRISYEKNSIDYASKVFLIHDVPTYFKIDSVNQKSSRFKLKTVNQYKGFLSDLTEYSNVEEYKSKEFTSKNRYSVNRKRKRLEACFNISFKVFSGHISNEDFDYLFSKFKEYLLSRFGDLKKENDVVTNWDYYNELAFEMINSKKAAFAVVYSDNEPISMSFNFLSDDVMFFAITSYSTLFDKFSLGHSSIEYLIDWCCKNGIKTFDMSKGIYLYKTRWSNKDYTFQNHILYDSSSIVSSSIATFLKSKYALKQYLRDKEINILYSKFKYFIRPKKKPKNLDSVFKIESLQSEFIDKESLVLIDLSTSEYHSLKLEIYNQLYKKPDSYSSLKVYKIKNSEKDSYYVLGEKNDYLISRN